MNIAKRGINSNTTPFIIAEMSGNHNQSIDKAFEIVDAAARSGVHALKLQTYTADTMTLSIDSDEFCINDNDSLWNGNKLHDLYNKAHTPWDWHKPIMDRAKKLGMLCFSSPFDETAVDFLESLEVPAYKIASFENTDLPLIRKVASTGKPIIISTGMATIAEIDQAVCTARESGCVDLTLLKCTSTYPATPKNSNVLTIPHLKKMFGCEVGLSDHTMGIGASIAAIAHGATVIEKHFTIDRAEGGVDSVFSLEPHEMSLLVMESKRAWQSLGKVTYGPSKDEERSLAFRRSIYIAQDLVAGEEFTPENLRRIRPGFGLEPKHYDFLIGKHVSRDVKRGTPLTWDLVS